MGYLLLSEVCHLVFFNTLYVRCIFYTRFLFKHNSKSLSYDTNICGLKIGATDCTLSKELLTTVARVICYVALMYSPSILPNGDFGFLFLKQSISN